MKKATEVVRNNFRFFLLMVLTILVLLYLFRFDFSMRIDYQVRDMVTDHLIDISHQSVAALDRERSRVEAEVRYTAEYLSQYPDISSEEEQLLYRQLKETCGFSNVRLVSEDGELYSIDHELLPRSMGGYIEAIGRGESGMTDVFLSSVTGEKVLAFYAPVYRDGVPHGGIVGIRIVDHMVDVIATTGFDSQSYNYILKADGTVVIQTSHENSLYQGRDYLKFLYGRAENGEKIAENLRKSMKNRESGVYFYDVGEESRIGYYEPANCNDWYVITLVSTQVMNEYIRHINRTAIYLTIKVVAVMLILAAMFIFWSQKTKKMILASKEATEVEKKKMELALRQSTNTIFEYKRREDCLTFITPSMIRGISFPHVIYEASANVVNRGIVAIEDIEAVLEVFRRVEDGKDQEPLEFAGGSEFPDECWFSLTISPVRDGSGDVIECIVTLKDITEEKNIRRRFAQEEQYREALLSESVAVWSVDLIKQQMITCTIAGENTLELDKSIPYQASVIQKIVQTVHPEERERVEEMMQISNMMSAYYTGIRELKDLFRMRYSGEEEYKWVSCVVSLLTEPTSGKPIAFAYVRDVDEETKRKIELSYSSERDPLTGLYNRRNIADKIDRLLQKEGSLSCLMMMDLDGFKGINDRYGHQMGDEVLKDIAQILLGSFRVDDLVARLGGDEFLVFLTDLPNCESACNRAEVVRQKVCEMVCGEISDEVSISIGLSFAPGDGNEFSKLYQCADEALYRAKRAGKNQIMLFEWQPAEKND